MSRCKHVGITAAIVTLSIFSIVFFYLGGLFQAPMEPVPLDGGWLGFLLIFANGFFFSFILAPRVGITERLLLSVGLGFGLTFAFMIIIGILFEISALTVVLMQIILLAALSVAAYYRGLKIKFGAFSWFKNANIRITKLNILPALLLIVIGIFTIVAFYDTLSLPATEWDSLAYGVNYAKIVFQKGDIPIIAGPSIGIEMSASYPPGFQLVAVFLYALAGNPNDFYYRLLSPIFSIATLMATYQFAMIVNKNRTVSIYAVFGLILVPFFWELFIQETYLMALTLMLTLSAYFFFKAYSSENSDSKKYEVIGTLFCGFAALTSYIGLLSFGVLLLYAAKKRLNVKRLVGLTALALLVILPWYSRNFFLLGDPLYPFLGIGKYLDPQLRISAAQHFRNYALIPFFGLSSALCKLGAGILVAAIAYLTFSKGKNLLIVLSFYFLSVGMAIMALHISFPRYLIIALPVLAVVCSTIIQSAPKRYKSPRITALILIPLIILSSTLMLPYINAVKPERKLAEDKWLYLSRIYEEGDAWKWINDNTPANARIATFDIKQYYVGRDILQLDGNESVPLYAMKTIEESIYFLQNKGVKYVLSVPWASPTDNRLPPAYNWTILTKFLGDPQYLPPLFIGINGATVYHVGPIDEETLYQTFKQKDMVPPLKHITVNLTITNNTSPYLGKFYLPIPVDYRGGLIVARVNSSKPLHLQLWNELIPSNKIEKPSEQEFMYIAQSPVDSSEHYCLTWHIDRAGYFTFLIVDREESPQDAFEITLDLKFYSYWEKDYIPI